MKIWTPKNSNPCHNNGYLQTAADVRAHRNRFRLNPLAKVGSLLVPQPLRFAGGRRRCCCEEACECLSCSVDRNLLEATIVISGFGNASCNLCGELNGSWVVPWDISSPLGNGECPGGASCSCNYSDFLRIGSDENCFSHVRPGLVIHYFCLTNTTSINARITAYKTGMGARASFSFGNFSQGGKVSCGTLDTSSWTVLNNSFSTLGFCTEGSIESVTLLEA